MIAPFWSDVDTIGGGSGLVYYKVTPTYVIIQWEQVGYYNSLFDKKNSFQLILSNSTDPIIREGKNVSFCYQDMQWTTGGASGGVGGFGGTAATVGINRGNGVDYVQFGRFDHAGGSYDGPYGANDGIDFLDYTYFSLDACLSNPNVPPIANSSSGCNTVHVCVGDTFLLSANFLSPEPSQVTSAIFLGSPFLAYNIVNNTSGNVASISVQITPHNGAAGYHFVTLRGIDNGVPADTTIVNVVIDVRAAGTAAFSIPRFACSGDTLNLVYTGTGLPTATYNWDLAGGSVISGSGSGPYALQWNNGINDTLHLVVSDNTGCRDSSGAVIQISPPITSAAIPTDLQCNNDNSGLATVNVSGGTPPYYYTWNTSPVQNTDTVFNLPPGNYNVVITDVNGCLTSDNVTISEPTPLSISVSFLADSCGISDGKAQATASGGSPPYSYLWSEGSTPTSDVDTKLSAGLYTVVANDDHGCTINTLGVITSGHKVEANFDFDPKPVLLFSQKCTFEDKSINAVQWYWNFGDGGASDLTNPVHYFEKSGSIPVTQVVYNVFGCTDRITKDVAVEGFYTFYLPSSFTPNGDGKNEIFQPHTTGVVPDNYRMIIFDRWGNEIFSSNDIQVGWNGKSARGNRMVSSGMYVYQFEFTDYQNESHKLAGVVSITN